MSLAGASPPASKRTKIPRKSKAVRCEAVLREQKCPQTMKSPQRILCVFSRALRKYEGISAPPNRGCPCQSTQGVPANASAAAFVGRGGAAERARPAARGGARDAQLAPTKGRPPCAAVQQALIFPTSQYVSRRRFAGKFSTFGAVRGPRKCSVLFRKEQVRSTQGTRSASENKSLMKQEIVPQGAYLLLFLCCTAFSSSF